MTLRILHVGKYFPPQRGGMETYLADLIAAQRAQGIDASALVHGDPLPDDPDWLVRVPVEFHLSYAPMALGFRSALARAIKRFEPDVLHLHMPNNSAFWALTVPAARALPWVVHWHSDVVVSKIKTGIAAAYWLYRPLEVSLLSRCERIIVTSPAYLEASEPLAFWRYKCAVVPMGLTPQTPSSTTKTAPPWRGTGLRLLSIGRLAYYKGFGTLIHAVAKLPNVELIIAGNGPLRGELQTLIENLTAPGQQPRIFLLGEVSDSDKHELLRSCDLFCLASRERTEAFGLVLFEAMHHARPCLVSDLPGSGMPWLIQQANAGWLAPVEDVEGWCRAIEHCKSLPDERCKRGHAGQHAVRTRFTLEASAKAISALYATLIDDSPLHAPPNDTLVVIPVRNAATALDATLKALCSVAGVDILVIDDHSDDSSADAARAAGVAVLRLQLRMTPWVAVQAGLRVGLMRSYRTVVTLGVRAEPQAEPLRKLLQMRECADLVIGTLHQTPAMAADRANPYQTDLRCYNRAALRALTSASASLLDYQDPGSRLILHDRSLRISELNLSFTALQQTHSLKAESRYNRIRQVLLTALLRLSYWPPRRAKLNR